MEEMHGVLRQYEEKLLNEIGKQAPHIVQSALSSATDALARSIEKHGLAAEKRMLEVGLESFGTARETFLAATKESSADMHRLALHVEAVQKHMTQLGGLLEQAATSWSPHASAAEQAMERLASALARLSSGGSHVPIAVETVCDALEEVSRRLIASGGALDAHAALLDEIEAAVREAERPSSGSPGNARA